MEADAIDSSKENIQPLRSGRKTHALGVALQAQTDTELQHKLFLEREEFELLIREYDGPDPLQPRYNYVLWLEQSFPKHGRESNLVPLLEDTISLFKNDKRYIQDIRFVLLIIKFIETQVNPLELFQVVFNQGIGTMCAILYKAWAEELDLCGDIKRADQIYQMGIKNHAQPVELLVQEHQQFQLSVGRRLLNGDIDDEADSAPVSEEPTRRALDKISLKKPGSLRPTLGKAGTVPLCLSNHQTPKANAPIPVYKENDSELILFGQGSKVEHFPKAESSHKENTIKPGTWNKKYSSGSISVASAYTPVTPKFKVHEDNDEMTAATPRQISTVPNALKTRKADTFHCPMAIFEPPDPTMQPMYPKHLVYAGGRESQLEEIRASIYNRYYKEKLIQAEMQKIKLSDSGKELGAATPECSSALTIPNQCQTGLTPMVLKSQFMCPFPVAAASDRGNQPPKCVSQLKFSHADTESVAGENSQSESKISTGPGKFGVFCDEDQMCSALPKEEPNEGAACESAQLPAIINEDQTSTLAQGCEVRKVSKIPSSLNPIIPDEDGKSCGSADNGINVVTTPATSSSTSVCSGIAVATSSATSSASTPLGYDFSHRQTAKAEAVPHSSKSSSSKLSFKTKSSKSSSQSKSSKLPFTIYCGD